MDDKQNVNPSSTAANASVEEANVRLNFLQRLPYFGGTFGGSFLTITILSMLSFYWTDVMLINPAMVSAFLLITKLWDAFNDPIIGYIADRTQTKSGRYRPWMLMCIPTSIFGLLTFVRLPGVSDDAASWFSMIMYFFYVLAATSVEVPGQGLIAATTTDFRSRGQVATFRMAGTFVGGIVIGAILLPMVTALGGSPTSQSGFTKAVLILVIIGLPLGIYQYLGTKERVKIPVSKHKISSSFGALKGNVPFWLFFAAFFMYGTTMGTLASRMYYWGTFFGDMGPANINMTAWAIGQVLGAIIYFNLTKKTKNKGTLNAPFFIIAGLIYIALFWYPIHPGAGSGVVWGYQILTVIAGTIMSVSVVGMYGVLPDITEYTQWKYRYRISGFVSSILNCSYKWSLAIGGAVFMAVMSAVGYDPTLGPGNTESVKIAINLFMHVVPGCCFIVAGLIMTRYKIDITRLESMRAEIAARTDSE